MDMESGYTFWDSVPIDQCSGSQHGVLYIGKGDKVVNRDAETVYTVTTEEVIFGLVARSSINVCGQSLMRTEHPRLLIHEVKNKEVFLRKKKIAAVNMDIYAVMLIPF